MISLVLLITSLITSNTNGAALVINRPNTNFSASSFYDDASRPKEAKFDGAGWAVAQSDSSRWLRVDLGDDYVIESIGTKGCAQWTDEWTTSYIFKYAKDGSILYTTYPGTFGGNSNWNTERKHFLIPVIARYIRFEIVSFQKWPSLRVEAYGYLYTTLAPTDDPTKDPTAGPTLATKNPTTYPTLEPTTDPTLDPTTDPTFDPTLDPTTDPTIDPTNDPTQDPTNDPTTDPTVDPTVDPTADPTQDPTNDPTTDPSNDPTTDPTVDPTLDPTADPTTDPTVDPTQDPTNDPTTDPTLYPSSSPTQPPTIAPTFSPTTPPTQNPTLSPSLAPTRAPTVPPSAAPTAAPTVIGKTKWLELFMYYNMTEGLKNIVLTVFNKKLSVATWLGIKYGAYQKNKEQYKFLYETYTCVAFTVSSFDKKSDDWKNALFDCDDYQKDLQKTTKSDKYKPETKRAQYLGVIKVLLTGDDEDDSRIRINELTDLLNGTNSTETQKQKRRMLGSQASFVDYTERCMKADETLQLDAGETCTGFLGLDLKYFEIITLDASFVTEYVAPKRGATVAETIVEVLKYIIYVFVGICFCVSVLGKVYAKRIGSDNVKSFGILFFSLYTWDFYSDIMFCVRLGNAAEWTLFIVSMVFIFVPWIMNLMQLFQAQKKWTTDKSVQEGVRGWFMDWSIILVVAVCLSGNSFGAIELANSNLFGADLFSMGLNPRHLKKFQSKRFYSSVLLENIPQLIVQIYFLMILGKFDEATFVALLSSSISVILSVVDIWSAKRLVTVMDNAEKMADGMHINCVEFTILNTDEIQQKKQILLTKPKALRKAISETLVIDRRTVEIYQLLAAENGIKVGFNVYANNYDIEKVIDDLTEEQLKFQLLITNYWELKVFPKLSEIREGHQNQNNEDKWNFITRIKSQSFNMLHPNYNEMQKKRERAVSNSQIPLNNISLNKIKAIQKKQNEENIMAVILSETESESKEIEDTNTNNMNDLQKYIKSQIKIYESHQMSKENPIIPILDSINNKEKDQQKLWQIYYKNIEKLLQKRLSLQFKYNKIENNINHHHEKQNNMDYNQYKHQQNINNYNNYQQNNQYNNNHHYHGQNRQYQYNQNQIQYNNHNNISYQRQNSFSPSNNRYNEQHQQNNTQNLQNNQQNLYNKWQQPQIFQFNQGNMIKNNNLNKEQEDESIDHQHETFVPPAPQSPQEIEKFAKWQAQRRGSIDSTRL